MPFVTTAIDGGLDLITAPQVVQPGRLIDVLNYEVTRRRGITRIQGYERFDGSTSPTITSTNVYVFTSSAFATASIPAGLLGTSVYGVGNLVQITTPSGTYTGRVIKTANTVNGANTTFVVYVVLDANNGLALSGAVITNAFVDETVVTSTFPFQTSFSGGGSLPSITWTYAMAPINTTNTLLAADIQNYYNTVRNNIQQVPGQGNINGIFWLKDRLYATRDLFAINFSGGKTEPKPGDWVFSGTNLGANNIWIATVAKVVVTSGGWSNVNYTGDAAGVLMVYFQTPDPLTYYYPTHYGSGYLTTIAYPGNGTTISIVQHPTAVNQNIVTSALTGGTAGAGNAVSTAADLYTSTGVRGRGEFPSWQRCNLGWNIGYNGGIAAFSDMNLAIQTPQTQKYQVTDWHYPSTGTAHGWFVSGSFPAGMKDIGANFIYHKYYHLATDNPISGIFSLQQFNFLASEIPANAAITGIEIQMVMGAIALSTNTTMQPIDATLQLYGVSGGPQPNLANATPYPVTLNAAADPSVYASYAGSWNTRDIGAPGPVAGVPTSTLGYTGITPANLLNPNFGILFGVKENIQAPTQNVAIAVDQVRMRVSYLPVTNDIYFWGGVRGSSLNDGHMTATSATLTSASANFSADMVGAFIAVNGAGTAGGTLFAKIVTFTNSTTVTLSVAASTTVTTALINIYWKAQHARIVKNYTTAGSVASSNAEGVLYLQFVDDNGNTTYDQNLIRIPGSGEQIRSWPANPATIPDGGISDGSAFFANTSTAGNPNFMDHSGLMAGTLQSDNTLSTPSKYQSVTKNFYASSGMEAMYGVSGGGQAFFYDGVKFNTSGNTTPDAMIDGNFVRINTGLPPQLDCPRSIVAHQGHIVLGYYAGMIQWSNAQNVLSFDPTQYDQTAGDNGLGEPVTTLTSLNGDALVVGCRSTIHMMQGNFNSPSTLYDSVISPTSGMIEYTIQPLAEHVYADFRGLTMLGATQKYGDFDIGHISAPVATWIIPRVQVSTFFESQRNGIINTTIARNKNQFRAYFQDGYALTMTFLSDGEAPQFTIQSYTHADGTTPFTFDVVRACTETSGRDRIFAATNDGTGYIYEIDRGNTFDGFSFPAYATLAPDTGEVAYQNKMFSGVNVFGQAKDYASFTLSRSSNYTAPTQATGNNVINMQFGSATAAPTGNTINSVAYGTSALQLEGTAINIRFDSNGQGPGGTPVTEYPHTIQAISYTVDPLEIQAQ